MPEFVAISPEQMPNQLKDLFEFRLLLPIIRDRPDLNKLFIHDTGELVQQLPGQLIGTAKEARDLLNSPKSANAGYTASQRQAIMGAIRFNPVPFVRPVIKTATGIFQKRIQGQTNKTSQNILDQSGKTKQYLPKTTIIHTNQQIVFL